MLHVIAIHHPEGADNLTETRGRQIIVVLFVGVARQSPFIGATYRSVENNALNNG